MCTTCELVRAMIVDWANKQGHDRCHYYPEILSEIAGVLAVDIPPACLPPRAEFEWGCRKFTDEEYEKAHAGNRREGQ